MNRKHSKQSLSQIVSQSKNWYEVLRSLNLKTAGGSLANIRSRCNEYGIDYSHFTGKAHGKGKIFGFKFPIEDYLSGKRVTGTYHLKLRLIQEKLKTHCCEKCLNTQWMESLIPIELHHIDGNPKNNLLSNLQILCPNCHAMTENHAGKNKGKNKLN